jgi:cytoskeletal protein RodZ
MKTVGEILKAERLKQNKTILQINRETKIPEHYLQALEANEFKTLPPDTFVKGFIKIYAQALGLPAPQVLAVFRRDWQDNKKSEIVPQGLSDPVDKPKLSWTPNTTGIFISSTLVAIFLSFLGFQLWRFLAPPNLVIQKPQDNQKTKEETIEIVGKVNKEASIYVNDQLINLNNKGDFSYKLKLFPGENNIVIVAQDRRGNKSTVTRKVQVDK